MASFQFRFQFHIRYRPVSYQRRLSLEVFGLRFANCRLSLAHQKCVAAGEEDAEYFSVCVPQAAQFHIHICSVVPARPRPFADGPLGGKSGRILEGAVSSPAAKAFKKSGAAALAPVP